MTPISYTHRMRTCLPVLLHSWPHKKKEDDVFETCILIVQFLTLYSILLLSSQPNSKHHIPPISKEKLLSLAE